MRSLVLQISKVMWFFQFSSLTRFFISKIFSAYDKSGIEKIYVQMGKKLGQYVASSDLLQADRLERNPSGDGLRNPLTLAISESVSGCVIYTSCNNLEYSRLFHIVVSLTSYGFNKVPVSSA